MNTLLKFLRSIGILRTRKPFTVKGKANEVIDKMIGVDIVPNNIGTDKTKHSKKNKKRKTYYKIVFLRLVSILFFIMFLGSIEDGFIISFVVLCLTLIVNPIIIYLLNKQKRYSLLRTSWFKVSFFVLFLIAFIILLPSEGDIRGEYTVLQGTADATVFRNFEYTLARLINAYQIASILEQKSLNVKYGDLTQQEYEDMLALLEIKREDVRQYAKKLESYKSNASTEIAMGFLIKKNTFVETLLGVYAQGESDYYKDYEYEREEYYEELPEDVKKAQKWLREKEDRENTDRKRKTADLIKRALPSIKRIDIVSAVFDESAEQARIRLVNRGKHVDAMYRSEMDYINNTERDVRIMQNGLKMIEGGGMIAIGLTPAGGLTLLSLETAGLIAGGADLGLTIMETNDLVTMTGNVGEGLTNLDDKYKMAKQVVGMTNLIFNTKTLLTNPKEWGIDQGISSKSFGEDLINLMKGDNLGEQSKLYYLVKQENGKIKIVSTNIKPDGGYNFLTDEDYNKFGELLDENEIGLGFKEILNKDSIKNYIKEYEKEKKEEEKLAKKRKEERIKQGRQELLQKSLEDKEVKEVLQKLKNNITPVEKETEKTKPKASPGQIVPSGGTDCYDAGLASICGNICKCCYGLDVSSCEGIDVQ